MALQADNRITLADGRLVSYAECGDPDGAPVVHLHGVPSCRLEAATAAIDRAAAALGVRLLAPDRPGVGLSDPKPGRTVLDYPLDVMAFADALEISRFSLVGWGGGAPFVAACALRIAHRLRAAGIVSGIAPGGHAQLTGGDAGERIRRAAARYAPWWLARWVRALAVRIAAEPERAIDQLAGTAPPADRPLVQDPDWREQYRVVLRETFRRGYEGAFDDFRAVYRDWGFSPSQVPMVVNLWFGASDTRPGAAGLALAAALERSEARVYPREGHHSFLVVRYEEILTGLLTTAAREDGRPVG